MGQPKNLITPSMVTLLRADFEANLYGHQKRWAEASWRRSRMIVEARQIGATWYFARERFLAALETGKDQIFIVRSHTDRKILLGIIRSWVARLFGFGLHDSFGEVTVARGKDDAGAQLPPVSITFREGIKWHPVGYHGDVIVQDFFWMDDFATVFKWAEALAWQSRFTMTFYSAINDRDQNHEARPIWTGAACNLEFLGKALPFDTPRNWLRDGYSDVDGFWRQIVTIEDAEAGGFDLVDKEALREAYSPEEFDALFMCKFSDEVSEGQRHV